MAIGPAPKSLASTAIRSLPSRVASSTTDSTYSPHRDASWQSPALLMGAGVSRH